MTTHRFAFGQEVFLLADVFQRSRAVYVVTALLPFERDIPFYKVKGPHEAFGRVVSENQLRGLPMKEPAAEALPAPSPANSNWFTEAAEFSRRRRLH